MNPIFKSIMKLIAPPTPRGQSEPKGEVTKRLRAIRQTAAWRFHPSSAWSKQTPAGSPPRAERRNRMVVLVKPDGTKTTVRKLHPDVLARRG